MPFEPSNSGVSISNWNDLLEGGVLKNVALQIGNQKTFGEIELTKYGFEGAPIYALSNQVRKGENNLIINLKSSFTKEVLQEKFQKFEGKKTEFLKAIKLSKEAVGLLKWRLNKEEFNNDEFFHKSIQKLQFDIQSLRPIDEVISTVGGISMNEIDAYFELKKYPNHFCIGEMLDWDAPTGGYLLQACFASGFVVAQRVIQKSF